MSTNDLIEQELDEIRQRLALLEATAAASQKPISSECGKAAGEAAGDTQAGPFPPPPVRKILTIRGETKRGWICFPRGRATIDNTRSDNGFLGGCYNAYKSCCNSTVLGHWSTAEAFANLRGGPEGFSVIVGHGGPGLQVCGTGQVVDGVDKFIAHSNIAQWGIHASRGVTGSQLTLFGCEVASGASGNQLLHDVANRVRKPVGAWTGLVWTNGSDTWGTGEFITVLPFTRVVPHVEAPRMYAGGAINVLRLATGGEEFDEVPIGQVKSVNFTPLGSVEMGKALRAERAGARSLLSTVDFENPFVTEDVPASILIGLLTITMEHKGAAEHTRTFRVLNHSLLQDVAYPNTYYYTSSVDLASALTK